MPRLTRLGGYVFALGVPVALILAAAGLPLWLVVVPCLFGWVSLVVATARGYLSLHLPTGPLSLEQSASIRRVELARAALNTALRERSDAFGRWPPPSDRRGARLFRWARSPSPARADATPSHETGRYLILVGAIGATYSAWSPDVPGCSATGATIESCVDAMHDALARHVGYLLEHGQAIPEPSGPGTYVRRRPRADARSAAIEARRRSSRQSARRRG